MPIIEREHVDTFREQIKRTLRKYIREQLERTQVQRPGIGAVGQQPLQNNTNNADLEQLISSLQASFAEMDKRKLEKSKRDPKFKASLDEIGDLVHELQNLLAPLQ